jgi:hypothetical protein
MFEPHCSHRLQHENEIERKGALALKDGGADDLADGVADGGFSNR